MCIYIYTYIYIHIHTHHTSHACTTLMWQDLRHISPSRHVVPCLGPGAERPAAGPCGGGQKRVGGGRLIMGILWEYGV